MAKRLETRKVTEQRAERAGNDLRKLWLGVAGPSLTRQLAVPQDIWLWDTPEGDALAICWRVPPSADGEGMTHRWRSSGRADQAFWHFLELADESRPESFIKFAERFGVLGLWPKPHDAVGADYWVPSSAEGIFTPFWDRERKYAGELAEYVSASELARIDEARYEPVAEWVRWAQWFRATLNIALDLRDDKPARQADWQATGWVVAFDPAWTENADLHRREASIQKREFAQLIERRFLRWSGLVPAFDWGDHGPRLSLSLAGPGAVRERRYSGQLYWPENTLFPALVAQLLTVVAMGQHVATCAGCGRQHPRPRKPRPDHPTRCRTCAEAVVREQKAASAAKRRSEGRRT